MSVESKNRVKILLVDDREDNLFSMQTVLEKDGYKLVKARSGREALKILLKEFDFTLILMDVQMPDINGLETAGMIYERDRLKHIPIIFITAHDYNEEYVFEGYKAGAVDYIYKPINPDLLRAKVAIFAELYKKNHQLRAQEMKLQQLNTELEERVRVRTEEILNKNQELEKINLELKKVNNDLDNFVYAASHDLKAPVSNLEGLMEALSESLSEDSKKEPIVTELLTMIRQSVARFKSTILDLTEITKIQKNLDEEVNSVDVNEVIVDVLASIKDMIDQNNAKIIVDSQKGVKINYSRKNLFSVILNLVSNAIKYKAEERAPEIHIKVFQDKDGVYLVVKDNGLGFNPADKPKIFGMFKRLHTHVDGSGIGLYIVKRILENTGGYIEAESVKGEGSIFKVCFRSAFNQIIVDAAES